jgi:hypothetical protein
MSIEAVWPWVPLCHNVESHSNYAAHARLHTCQHTSKVSVFAVTALRGAMYGSLLEL